MGYPELGLNDLYIDGLIIYMAKAAGMEQVILKSPMQIFHINHKNSTSEHANRIKRCDNLDYEKEYRPWCQKMIQEGRPLTTNNDHWGLAQKKLKEYIIDGGERVTKSKESRFGEFGQWITKLAVAQNRLYYRDQTPESMNALVELVHQYQPTKIIEMGTLSGLSLRAWLSADSDAEVIAIDLSLKPLHQSQQVLPVDLSRVRLLEQDILKIDFSRLWTPEDRILLYVDAHDQPNVPIMEHVLQNALPSIPTGSIVAVDDLWYSPSTLDSNNSFKFFEDTVIPQFDPIIYRTLNYAPYWEGGSFVGFPEVVPLMQWANQHAIKLRFKSEVKMVFFEPPLPSQKIVNFEFDPENFHRMTGVIKPKPLEGFAVYNENTAQTKQALDWCKKGVIAFESDNYSETIACFEQALGLHPTISGAYYAEAVCLTQMGKFEDAVKMLHKEIENPYPHPNARTLLDDIQERIRIHQKSKTTIPQQSHKQEITIFACPKPFRGHADLIQRNAIKSWTLLKPGPEIILFGNEYGTASIAKELGLLHIPDVECNEFGTPLISSIFEKLQNFATNKVLVYINADIILLSNFPTAIQTVYRQFPSFLIIGQRWDTEIDFPVDYSKADWESQLVKHVKSYGTLHPSTGIDYFVFNKGLLQSIPPFAVGRPAWDNWMVYNAVMRGIPVLDATQFIFVIHQDHSYLHVKGGKHEAWNGVEAQRNRSLCGEKNIFTIEDATWKLTDSGLTQISSPATIFFNKGLQFLDSGNPTAALESFDKTLKLEQFFPNIYCARAVALVQTGRLDDAVASVQTELTLQPNHEIANHLLSDINRIQQTQLTKQQDVPKSPSIAPPYPPNLPTQQILVQNALQLCKQANSLISQGNFVSALHYLDEAMYKYPKIENLQYLRASCLWKLGRLDEAKIAITAEIKAYPGNPNSNALLTSILSEYPNKNLDQKTILREQESLCIFLNVDYQAFLNSHYRNNPQLQSASYQEQLISLQEASFGDSDFYSEGLKKAGWNAADLIINCLPLQSSWAAENNFHNYSNILEITIEQIRRARPQAVYFQDISIGTSDFLSSIRPYTDLIVGQIACAISPGTDFSKFDIIISSFPFYVEQFRTSGLNAYYQPLAFDPRVLQKLHNHEKIYPVTFVGGLGKTRTWVNRTALLEYLAESITIDFWGYGTETLSPDSQILRRHHGEAWGLDMLSVLHQSSITINCHGEIAGNYANNVRLFEATGCGALLITEYKDNLNELFEIGKEVVAYRSTEECAALIKYYLSNPEEAKEIARAGQARTFRDHTFDHRMSKTAEILRKRIDLRKSILERLVKPKF